MLTGHKGLRADILLEIKKSQPVTAKQLGATFKVSANAVRRHLKELESEGLVRFGREHKEVGAPAFAYSLTALGEALFPNGYQDALTELLAHMAAKDGRAAVVALFEQRYAELARRGRAEVEAAPERRLATVARILTEAGYMADWSETDGTFSLAEHNCAMRAVVAQFPEICEVEQRFLKDLLGAAAVERRQHIGSGCNSCEYAISFSGAEGCASPAREEV